MTEPREPYERPVDTEADPPTPASPPGAVVEHSTSDAPRSGEETTPEWQEAEAAKAKAKAERAQAKADAKAEDKPKS